MFDTPPLRIKTAAVKRLTKDKLVYERELRVQEAKLNRFLADGSDDAEVRHQRKILEETKFMVPDTQRRLLVACNELTTVLGNFTEFQNIPEYLEAQKALADARRHLPKQEELHHMC
ncbi:tubulin-specific chaperone A-like [Aethina tumida]|uniref:tubulin-specific chaperone A-like n=1 Tax=Aethina tumida TaxID=116153 RepID=UPI002148CE08|nr:tubulin-specific chaperone A-like [Aethina tumida]